MTTPHRSTQRTSCRARTRRQTRVSSAVLTAEAPAAIERLERFGVEFTHDADGRYRLARCGGATRKRLLQVGDRTGHAISTALRGAVGSDARIETLDHAPLLGARRPRRRAGARRSAQRNGDGGSRVDAGAIVLAAGGRCYAEAKRLGTFSTNAAGATGEVTEIALARRLRGARHGRAAVPPERRPLAGVAAGLLDPRDDARLRRRAAQRRRRALRRRARRPRRGCGGNRARVRRGARG